MIDCIKLLLILTFLALLCWVCFLKFLFDWAMESTFGRFLIALLVLYFMDKAF